MAYNYEYPYTDPYRYNADWLINKVKELATEWAKTLIEWTGTKEEFEALKNYVNNYFKNLDVSVEVSEIIDGLIKDGTIAKLISTDILAFLTPQMYGAIGDGVTDDYNAFVACYHACVEKKLSMFLPKGEYLLSDTLNITDHNFTLFGTGDGSIIKNNNGTAIKAGVYDYTGIDDFSTELFRYFISIRDIKIINASIGISVNAASRARFTGISLQNCNIGIQVNAYSHWNLFDDIISMGCTYGIKVNGEGADANYNSTGCIYNNIRISGNSDYGIYCGGKTFGDMIISNVNGVLSNNNGSLIALIGDRDGFYAERISVCNADLDGVGACTLQIGYCSNVTYSNIVRGGAVNHAVLKYGYNETATNPYAIQSANEISFDQTLTYVHLQGTNDIQTINNGYNNMEVLVRPVNGNINLISGGNIIRDYTLNQNTLYKLKYIDNHWFVLQ